MIIQKLKEIISDVPDDFYVVDSTGETFIHCLNIPDKRYVLSTQKPIGHCLRCGQYIYKELLLDYAGFCVSCNENMFSFEFTNLNKKS